MESLHLSRVDIHSAAQKAAEILVRGGMIVYPTDTLYGLGVDAFSDETVDKVYALKARDPKKPIHAVFANVDMIEEYAEINAAARTLIQEFLPGPLTLVLRKKSQVQGGIARGMETIGVRIPDNMFCVATADAFGRPFTATSANTAGNVTGRTIPEILEQFGEGKSYIDLVVDAGELVVRKPSTVVDVTSGVPVILREGAIRGMDIKRILRA